MWYSYQPSMMEWRLTFFPGLLLLLEIFACISWHERYCFHGADFIPCIHGTPPSSCHWCCALLSGDFGGSHSQLISLTNSQLAPFYRVCIWSMGDRPLCTAVSGCVTYSWYKLSLLYAALAALTFAYLFSSGSGNLPLCPSNSRECICFSNGSFDPSIGLRWGGSFLSLPWGGRKLTTFSLVLKKRKTKHIIITSLFTLPVAP